MQKQNFKIDKEFYPDSIISLWVEAFDGFSIKASEWNIEISSENPQEIFDEFSNYCIALSNESFS